MQEDRTGGTLPGRTIPGGGEFPEALHTRRVDGGAVAQTFLYPANIPLVVDMRSRAFNRERRAYIIRNGRLDPDWAAIDRQFLSIAGRAIATMIHYSGVNDILRIYATTKRDGVDYNLAYIGADFPEVQHEQQDDQSREAKPKPNHLAFLAQKGACCPTNRLLARLRRKTHTHAGADARRVAGGQCVTEIALAPWRGVDARFERGDDRKIVRSERTPAQRRRLDRLRERCHALTIAANRRRVRPW